ncbi:MAG TPA: hypothetical protein VHH36_05435, partial [Candidatus Thermoplasmatota archaeon]|nr:hypothetical protein [Candidatus Thermoplasmatota archaeon]
MRPHDPPGGPRYQVAPSAPAPPPQATPEAEPLPRTAVLVAHGMGQQVEFETLDLVANGVLGKDGAGGPRRVRTVRVGDKTLRRLEAEVPTAAGPREVHFYEAYWAPLTEGRVTLRDTLGFLVRGGFNGAVNGQGPFRRWLFGRMAEFPENAMTTFWLLLGVAFIAALAVMHLVSLAVLVGPGLGGRLADEATLGLFAFLAALAPFLALLGLVSWKRRGDLALASSISPVGMGAFYATLAVGIMVALSLGAGAAVRAAHADPAAVGPRVYAWGAIVLALSLLLGVVRWWALRSRLRTLRGARAGDLAPGDRQTQALAPQVRALGAAMLVALA